MDQIYAIASPSSSTLYGNVGSAIKELILSKFPYNYFKYVNVSTELAFRNIRRNLKYNSDNEMTKRDKPYLVIKPVYSVSNSDQFLYDIPLTKNFDNIEYGLDKRYLMPLFKDVENNYSLKFKLNRDKIDFDITLTLATLHQQLDVYKAIQNQLVWDRPYSYNAGLECMIPRSIMQSISTLIGYDIDNNPSRVPAFIKYLKGISQFPITYKIRNASASDEFFMYYMHSMIVEFTDLTLDDVVRKNMTDDYYNITFRVSAEFNLPGMFALCGNNDKLYNLKVDLVDNDNGDKEFIPICTFSNFYNKYPSVLNGLKLYTTSMFNVEENPVTKEDYLDIGPLFEEPVLTVLKGYIGLDVSMSAIMNIIIIKDTEELTYDTDWKMDYNKMRVTIYKLEKTSTYRIVIYLNMLKINDQLVENFEYAKSRKESPSQNELPHKLIQNSTTTGGTSGTTNATIIPSQSKMVSPTITDQVISADEGYALTSVIVAKIPDQYTQKISEMSNEDIQSIINSKS